MSLPNRCYIPNLVKTKPVAVLEEDVIGQRKSHDDEHEPIHTYMATRAQEPLHWGYKFYNLLEPSVFINIIYLDFLIHTRDD